MGADTKTLYETDFAEWAKRTAELLRAGRFDEADLEHAAEEIEDLARVKRSAVLSQLRRILMHLVKQRIQPERDGASWHCSILDGILEIQNHTVDSPSLGRFAEENLQRLYKLAVRKALIETGITARRANLPETCPYTLKELLESEDPQP